MAVDDWDGEVVLYGDWLYDGTVPVAVEIVAFDRDFFRDRLIFDDDEDPARPAYDPDARFHYVRFDGSLIDTEPFASVEAVMDWVRSMDYGVEWRDTPPVRPQRPTEASAFSFPPISGKASGRLQG